MTHRSFRLGRLALLVALGAALASGVAPAAASTLPALVPAGVDDFSFDSFAGDYRLTRDADGRSRMTVVETFVTVFPDDIDQNHGIVRAIPSSNQGVDLDIRDVSVTDETGAPVPYTSVSTGGFLELRIGSQDSYVHGRVVYVIGYTMSDVVLSFPAGDGGSADEELYWDANGTGWPQNFGSATARVHLPAELAPAVLSGASCYAGPDNAVEPRSCAIASTPDADTGGVLIEASTGALGPYETLTFAIPFAVGTFTTPARASESWLATVAPWLVTALTAVPVLVMLLVRFILWRDARGRGIVVPQYAPPRHSGVLVAADILGTPRRAAAAAIVSLAVNGAVRIMEDPTASRGDRWSIQATGAHGELASDDREVFDRLFVTSDDAGAFTVQLRRSDAQLGDRFAALVRGAHTDALDRGLRTRQGRLIPRLTLILAWLLAAVGIALVVWVFLNRAAVPELASMPAQTWFPIVFLTLPFVVGCVLGAGTVANFVPRVLRRVAVLASGSLAVILVTSIPHIGTPVRASLGALAPLLPYALAVVVPLVGVQIVAILSSRRDPLTPDGAEYREQLLGLRDYIRLAEADRLRVLQSPSGAERAQIESPVDPSDTAQLLRLNEKLLPYAILFGLEKQWVQQLGQYSTGSTPAWYTGTDFGRFDSGFAGMSSYLSAGGGFGSGPSWSSLGGSSSSGGADGGGSSGGGGGGGGGGGW
ncbi:MAG: DUF2207 domain-containing protein [Protaetiibacter sp.]